MVDGADSAEGREGLAEEDGLVDARRGLVFSLRNSFKEKASILAGSY